MYSIFERVGVVFRIFFSGFNFDYFVLYGKYLNGFGRLFVKIFKSEVRLVKLFFFNMLDELLKFIELGEFVFRGIYFFFFEFRE